MPSYDFPPLKEEHSRAAAKKRQLKSQITQKLADLLRIFGKMWA
jgi:hypothetical protein